MAAPSTDPVYRLTPGPEGGPTGAANKIKFGISTKDVATITGIVANVVFTASLIG